MDLKKATKSYLYQDKEVNLKQISRTLASHYLYNLPKKYKKYKLYAF